MYTLYYRALPCNLQTFDHSLRKIPHDILSEKSFDVSEQLKQGFELEEIDWIDGNLTSPYALYYNYMSEMLPRVQAKHSTPSNPALRSNTHLPSSLTRLDNLRAPGLLPVQ